MPVPYLHSGPLAPRRAVAWPLAVQVLLGGVGCQLGWVALGLGLPALWSVLEHGQRFPQWLFAGLLPVIGLALILSRLPGGWRILRLLAGGVPATGRLVRLERLKVDDNGDPTWRVVFAFTATDGRPAEAAWRTTRLDDAWLPRPAAEAGRQGEVDWRVPGAGIRVRVRVQLRRTPAVVAGDALPSDAPGEPLLYDPRDPASNMLLREAGPGLTISDTAVTVASPLAAVLLLVLPALAILGNAWLLLQPAG